MRDILNIAKIKCKLSLEKKKNQKSSIGFTRKFIVHGINEPDVETSVRETSLFWNRV